MQIMMTTKMGLGNQVSDRDNSLPMMTKPALSAGKQRDWRVTVSMRPVYTY